MFGYRDYFSYQPGSWGSRVPCRSTAHSPHRFGPVARFGFCIHRWTTATLEHPLRDKPARWRAPPPTPESSWGVGREADVRGGEKRTKALHYFFCVCVCVRGIQTKLNPLKLIRWRTVKRRVYLHRKPCVSNLRLNLNHLIWTSAVGKQLKEPSSWSELGAKTTLCVQDAELYADYTQRNRRANLITACSGFSCKKVSKAETLFPLLWV